MATLQEQMKEQGLITQAQIDRIKEVSPTFYVPALAGLSDDEIALVNKGISAARNGTFGLLSTEDRMQYCQVMEQIELARAIENNPIF